MAGEREPEVVDRGFVAAHLTGRALATVLIPKADGGMCIALRTDRYWQIGAAADGTSLLAVDLMSVSAIRRPLVAQARPLGDLPVGRPPTAVDLDDDGGALHLTMADGSVLHLAADRDGVHASVDGPDDPLFPRFSSVVQVRAAASDALGRALGRAPGPGRVHVQ